MFPYPASCCVGHQEHNWLDLRKTVGSWHKAPFLKAPQPLGTEYGAARERADTLNRHLDDWRAGRGADKSLDTHVGVGTVEWMVERYKPYGMEDVSKRSRPEYERAFNLVLRQKTTIGIEVGAAPIKVMTTLGVEKLYKTLKKGTRVKYASAKRMSA